WPTPSSSHSSAKMSSTASATPHRRGHGQRRTGQELPRSGACQPRSKGMTWIKTVSPEQAGPELRQMFEAVRALYPREYADPVAAVVRPDGSHDSVVAAHSLIPEAMQHMMSGLAVLLRPHLPLTRRQQEMIAAVVSVANHCFY